MVAVPEAEALVNAYRDRYDRSAALGVPAHITVLYPFLAPADIDGAVLDVLRQCLARHPPFRFALADVGRFARVLYLAPRPAEPFRRLTRMVWDCYPETPPYGGRFSDIVPHLTVAETADERQLDAVAGTFADACRGRLPIEGHAAAVVLMDNTPGRWRERARFPLGG